MEHRDGRRLLDTMSQIWPDLDRVHDGIWLEYFRGLNRRACAEVIELLVIESGEPPTPIDFYKRVKEYQRRASDKAQVRTRQIDVPPPKLSEREWAKRHIEESRQALDRMRDTARARLIEECEALDLALHDAGQLPRPIRLDALTETELRVLLDDQKQQLKAVMESEAQSYAPTQNPDEAHGHAAEVVPREQGHDEQGGGVP